MSSLEPTYEQLKIMYPSYYQRQIEIQNFYNEPYPDVNIERNLRSMYLSDPVPLPKEPTYEPVAKEPTYATVAKEKTSYLIYLIPVLIAALLIIYFNGQI